MINVMSSFQRAPVKDFLKTALLSAGIFTSSIFVYAQNETDSGVVINGLAISKDDIAGQYFDRDTSMSEDFRNRYLEAAEGAYYELAQQEGESADAQALRIARLYLTKQRVLTGLEEYATQLEAAYNNLEADKNSLEKKVAITTGLEEYATQLEAAYDEIEKDKISLEKKVAMLEQENTRLLKQN